MVCLVPSLVALPGAPSRGAFLSARRSVERKGSWKDDNQPLPAANVFFFVFLALSERITRTPSSGDQGQEVLPSSRSPVHHGTDPDLSASAPLPAGVASTGLDLSPVTAGSCDHLVSGRNAGVKSAPVKTAAARKVEQSSFLFERQAKVERYKTNLFRNSVWSRFGWPWLRFA